MNSLTRFLTFSARFPTHVYETTAYMTARLLLGALAFFASYAASPAHVAPFLLLSFAVSIGGASAAQTVRSGAARRQERREREGTSDVSLTCDADLRRAATLGSMLTSCAPMLALGQALASHAVGALRGWALVAALLSVAQSAFDVAWSLWIFPAWRRTYTRERDRLRRATTIFDEREKDGDLIPVGSATSGDVAIHFVADSVTISVAERWARENPEEYAKWSAGDVDASDDAHAPTCIFSGPPVRVNEGPPGGEIRITDDGDGWIYIRCDSLDDLLARTAEPAPVGTRLYTTDESPIVEYGGPEKGWFVDWTGCGCDVEPVDVLRKDIEKRTNFEAIAAGDVA